MTRALVDWPRVIPLLAGARDAMIAALQSDVHAKRIDPFDPGLRQYLIASMGSLADERLRILFLDSANFLIADEELQHGTLAQLVFYPRTIFRRALELNAASLILVHNHPSGDPKPSKDDVIATRRLDEIGRALDVRLLDHIVVTARHAHHIVSDDILAGDAPKPSAFTLRSGWPPRGGNDDSQTLDNARSTMRRRLLRRQLLGHDELFGEPAWDMLLDLFVHDGEAKPLATSSLCAATGIPSSSAMKLVQRLCDADLLERTVDIYDRRRTIVKLTPEVAHKLRAYFAEGTE